MILLTPVRARIKEDIVLREKILKENVGKNYPYGFEVKLLGGAKGDINYPEVIAKNLKSYSENPDFLITLHGPIERKDFSSAKTDLTEKSGLRILEKVLRLAKRINARLVNLHTEKIYSGKELIGKRFSLEEKRMLQKKIKEGVIRVKEKIGYQGKVAFENMPCVLMGDTPGFKTAEEMVFDPLLITAGDFFVFSEPDKKIGVCLDTSHYGITQKTIDVSKNKDLVGIPEEDVKKQPELTELAEKLGDNLFYVHFADFKNIWVPGKSYSLEGVVPGEGDFGEELEKFLKYLEKKEIPVMLEIYDKNLKNLNETKKSIKWVINNI